MSQSKLTSSTQNNQNQALCCNCLHHFGRVCLFCKQMFIHCKTVIVPVGYTILFSSFFTCGGSYLKRPRRWIIPLTTNPFATVERMRAPVGSPPGPAGAFSSAPLPEQLRARAWIPHLIIHSVPSLGPGHTPAATGTGSLLKASKGWRGETAGPDGFPLYLVCPSVCLSPAKSSFFASVFCSEH